MPAPPALIFLIVFKPMASNRGVCRNSQQKTDWRNAEQQRLFGVQT
jgi:hypothetical protein